MSGNETVAGFMRAGTNIYTDQNYGYGLVGLYNSARYQWVFAMGDAYKLAADGTTPGNLYGIAWTHENVGWQSKAWLGHQALFMANWLTQTVIGNGIWTRASIQAEGDGRYWTTSSRIFMNDSDESTTAAKSIHANSNLIWFLNWAGSWQAYWDNSGHMWNAGNITSNASIYAYNYYYNSDRNLKKNIIPISNALEKIQKLQGYEFDWKKDDTHSIWVIAQEVEKIFPELVSESQDAYGKKFKTVQYGNLVAPLIEATKELSAQNQAQDREIEEMRQELAELKKIIQHLEASTQK